MNILVLPVVLALLALLGWAWFRPGRRRASHHSRPWHPVIRALAAVLAICMLMALAIRTWRSANSPQVAEISGSEELMQVPASSLEPDRMGNPTPGQPPERFQL